MGEDVLARMGVFQRVYFTHVYHTYLYFATANRSQEQYLETGIRFASINCKHFLFKVCSRSHHDPLLHTALQCVHDPYRHYSKSDELKISVSA